MMVKGNQTPLYSHDVHVCVIITVHCDLPLVFLILDEIRNFVSPAFNSYNFYPYKSKHKLYKGTDWRETPAKPWPEMPAQSATKLQPSKSKMVLQ